METITHKYSGRIYQAKVTKCHHHLLRHISIGIDIKPTRWRRVSASTVKQLKLESVEFGSNEVMKHKPIQSTQRISEPRKDSNVTFYSIWALIAAGLAVALYFGIKWRLGL